MDLHIIGHQGFMLGLCICVLSSTHVISSAHLKWDLARVFHKSYPRSAQSQTPKNPSGRGPFRNTDHEKSLHRFNLTFTPSTCTTGCINWRHYMHFKDEPLRAFQIPLSTPNDGNEKSVGVCARTRVEEMYCYFPEADHTTRQEVSCILLRGRKRRFTDKWC